MSRSHRRAQREELLRDMAAIAALLLEANGPLPAETLIEAMSPRAEGEQRSRLRSFCCEGWIDSDQNDTAWLRGHGRFRLGHVRLWQLELAEIDDGDDRRRP